jgi:hypothetical protein
MTYPSTFSRPPTLAEYIQGKGWSHSQAADHFQFSEPAIQKMIKNTDRDIGVWNDQIVETKSREVVLLHANDQHIQWPYTQRIIFSELIQPRGRMSNDEC